MNVVPLRTIVFQAMFVLIAIAIQSYIFRRQLQVSPRTSVEYAATIELLSVVTGWLLFFTVESLLPQVLRLQLLNFIFFNQWSQGMESWAVPTAIVTFFLSFFLKLEGLILLKRVREEPREEAFEPRQAPTFATLKRPKATGTRLAAIVLLANLLSYSAISLVLVLRQITLAAI